jgi:1,4-alpha-glucan branching enzyme
MSAMNYFLTYFHFDGIRVDAVSNIVYWDGNKANGENTGSTEFIKRLNGKLHLEHPEIMMIAEDSPISRGHQTVEYGRPRLRLQVGSRLDERYPQVLRKDPIYKKWEHNKLTFSMAYFYSENFLLPLKPRRGGPWQRHLINKMFGDYDNKFALLRNLYAYQFGHPGKKLNFMGNELAASTNGTSIVPCHGTFSAIRSTIRSEGMPRPQFDLSVEDAMKCEEYNPAHFQWMMVDNSDQSVFAFEREFGESDLLFVYNMTPNLLRELRCRRAPTRALRRNLQ